MVVGDGPVVFVGVACVGADGAGGVGFDSGQALEGAQVGADRAEAVGDDVDTVQVGVGGPGDLEAVAEGILDVVAEDLGVVGVLGEFDSGFFAGGV